MTIQKSCSLCKGNFCLKSINCMSATHWALSLFFRGRTTAAPPLHHLVFFSWSTVPVAQFSPGFKQSLQCKLRSQRYLIPFPVIFLFFSKACLAKPHCCPWWKEVLFFLTILAVMWPGSRTSFSSKTQSIMGCQSNPLFNSWVVIHSHAYSAGSKWLLIPIWYKQTKGRSCLWGKWKEQQQLIVIKSLSAVAIKLQRKKNKCSFPFLSFLLHIFFQSRKERNLSIKDHFSKNLAFISHMAHRCYC